MLKLRALNTEYSSDEDAPGLRKEAQEEIAIDTYNKALRLQCNNNHDEAKDLLYQLLNANIPLLEANGGLPKTMSTIKYSCYMNIGTIAMKQNNDEEALKMFLTATELDKTDVTLWYKIGALALKLDKFQQSAYAFAQGLTCSESHWPCLDQLISLLFAMQETIACLQYIGKALTLDSGYVKGVVLRRQIYRDNPATEEYYKKFNADHIHEPEISYEVTAEEEVEFLGEVRKLTDRINEAEKQFAPKPLSTIPLPRGLKDFTWVELGRTVTELHQYLTDNNMTHLTKVDIKRCMSIDGTTMPVIEAPTEEERHTAPENIACESKTAEAEIVNDVEMAEVDDSKSQNAERRPSQNSENDGDLNTSIHPIESEENEQENDEQGEQEDVHTPKQDASNRSMSKSERKRKRDLVSELQIWGWHSKRKATKRAKTDKDYRIEDALTRIIPIYLMPNGLPADNMELFEDSRSPIDILSNDDQSAQTDTYFGNEEENKEVKQFWSRNWTNRDAIDLIQAFVHAVANLWKKKWPVELIDLYVTAYNMLREHASHPDLFTDPIEFEPLKKDALCTLLFGELTSHTNNKKYLEEEIHCTSVHQLTMLSGWEEYWGDEYSDFAVRVHWLRAHLFKQNNQNNLAIMALQCIYDVVKYGKLHLKTFKLTIPNNEKHHIINNTIIEAMLSKLELIDSLSRVEHLFEKQSYGEVAEILKLTFNSNNKVTYGKIGRQAQLGMLMHSLWYTNQTDCFIWTEKCLHEALKFVVKPVTDFDKWEMVVEKCLLIMYELIKNETVSIIDILQDDKRCRLVETLTTLCRKQINTEQTRMPMQNFLPYPWILLHYILLRDEHRQQAKKVVNHISKDDRMLDTSRFDDDDDLPASIAILFSAHEFLGPKAWCLAKQGELLHFMLDSIIHRLDAPILEPHRDKIDIHLEQAFFCLYQHPCKKNKVSRHLADHNVNPLPLSWDRAQQLYEYFCPEALPEFDSYKSISISSDLEQLLQRVTAIIPKDCDPQPFIPKISDYIHGASEVMPKTLDFPPRIKAIYYLLGDYYFKQSETKRSYKYFLLDLSINPARIDTWAGLSLGIHSQLESKLNHCERFKNEMEFIDKAKSAKICFQEALKLNNEHVTLWIEFGSFEYMVHSYCSRMLKYESENLSMEKFEALETEKEAYLESSGKSFQRALELQNDQADADERWLFHYMLGKIAEKKQADPKTYLDQYMQAASLLHENKCQYPEKINYNNPQHLSLEALEVHYRINASILKFLEAHDGKQIPASMGKFFKKCLDSSVIQKSKYDAKASNKTDVKGDGKSDEDVANDVKKCLDDLLDKVEKSEKEQEKGSDSDDVVIIDSDKEEDKEASKKEKEVVALPKIKVRNIQDIMADMIKENLQKENKDHCDTGPESVGEGASKCGDDKSEKSEKDGRSEDEANIRKSTTTATEDSSSSSSSSSSSTSSDSESDDSSATSSTDSSNENMSDSEILSLAERCIVGLEHCIRRLPQNYKALYRLAHAYYSYSKKKDLNKCKQLLMGEYKCKNSVLVPGLFSDRKTSNFFNGIWRIPSSEIDRPGSLSAHMSRCVTLLLQVLRDTQDHKTLLELCLQWRRVPDQDKVYIRHSEREQLSDDALTMCTQSLRSQIKDIDTMSPQNADRLLVDLYKAYQRSQKNLPHQEKVFAGMLTDAFKKLKGDKVIENVNINSLDMALKHCQQTKVAEKQSRKSITTMSPKPVLTAPLPTQPPIVQPSPSNVNIPPQPPLKRPSLGRPRGRPPGSTKFNSAKAPRGRSPLTNPYSWPNPLFPQTSQGFDFYKLYQDELLRQYSQSQFSTLFGAGLGMPPTAATASSLLNPSTSSVASNPLLNANLLQTMSQLSSGLSSTNQLTQVLSQMSPAMLKQTLDSVGQMSVQNSAQLLAGMSALGQQAPKPKHKQAQKMPSASASCAMPSTGFKYPTSTEVKRKQSKPKVPAPSAFNQAKDIPMAHSTSSAGGLPMDKSNTLMKDRPGISITPIAPSVAKVPSGSPGTSGAPMPTSSSPGKTLQEKLADKQKQQKQAAKCLDFSAASGSSVSALPYPMLPTAADLKNYQNVIPNYLLGSGLSISQVQHKTNKPSPQHSNKPKQASNKMPISMSVVKKSAEKKPKRPADDDVIIIE